MNPVKKALSDLLERRENWASAGNLWMLAIALIVPFGLALPLGRLALARVTSRRNRNFYSN
ncbi:MAG TPA: hypothetical protein VJA45_00915 [Methylomirabilota bacterium]|jgi:hypothetical protein|nr:hypothetical protein [Methylomirabilota bacterium]